jgi:hypothetical protein
MKRLNIDQEGTVTDENKKIVNARPIGQPTVIFYNYYNGVLHPSLERIEVAKPFNVAIDAFALSTIPLTSGNDCWCGLQFYKILT